MSKELVSIVIPLFNSEKFIKSCVLSCLEQEYENLEVLVIDDGSTDGGFEIVKEIAKDDSRVVAIHTSNKGVSSARNTGIKKSHGEYVCFVDADDCLDKRFIKTMAEYMHNLNADFCFSKRIRKDTDVDTEVVGESGRVIPSSSAETLLLSQEVAVGCWNKMYRRDILLTNMFREDLFYGEGLYFICKIAHWVRKIVVCEDALYYYRKVNPESATAKFSLSKMKNGEKSLLEIRKIIRGDGRDVVRMWSQHYCLFCINAMVGILYKYGKNSEYYSWRKKILKNVLSGLCARSGIRIKTRLFVAIFAPSLLVRRMRCSKK